MASTVTPASSSGSQAESKPPTSISYKPPQSEAPVTEKKCVFKAELLQYYLMPVLDQLCQDPNSVPFRMPVDAQALKAPDYHDVIKNPMDLSTIRMKLTSLKYTDPWDFVDDVFLIFDNAWLYNRKTSKVYSCCTKLAEIFEAVINKLMMKLGFCCGRRYPFSPQSLYCYGKKSCTIRPATKYFSFNNTYTYCANCFLEIQGPTVTIENDETQISETFNKLDFVTKRNDQLEIESFIVCRECGRKFHEVCVLHMDCIWPLGFSCKRCLEAKNSVRRTNKFTAEKLRKTKLGDFVENRVNTFLRSNHADAADVFIRVLSSSDKFVEVKPQMKNKFVSPGDLNETFPYRAKSLFAFETINDADVCFFGMHVQEYGSDCPEPNSRRVYIAYLDSVHFFRPSQYRTAVYHEIILGYLDYVKKLGYMVAHIWACPPNEGDDYIFNCHPAQQKIPKASRLQEWYVKLLAKGVNEGIVLNHMDISRQAAVDKLTSVVELPYFDGDFWPTLLEESITELDEEEKRCSMESNHNEMQDQSHEIRRSRKDTRKSSKPKAPPKMNIDPSDLLANRIFEKMEKYKSAFFVTRLHPANSSKASQTIVDPDPLIECSLMDGRDAFLALSREHHYEFSSMRRAKHSTMALLYELHNKGQERLLYTCDSCRQHMETRYHCSLCTDFDLCIPCFEKNGHAHQMDKIDAMVVNDCSKEDSQDKNEHQNLAEAKKGAIQKYINFFVHASLCRDDNCTAKFCRKTKRIMAHTKVCSRRTLGGCRVCKQVMGFYFHHAKYCTISQCEFLHCYFFKEALRLAEAQNRAKAVLMLKRRLTKAIKKEIDEKSSNQPPPISTATISPPNADGVPIQSGIKIYAGKIFLQIINKP